MYYMGCGHFIYNILLVLYINISTTIKFATYRGMIVHGFDFDLSR